MAQTFLMPGALLSLRAFSISGVSVCSTTTTRSPCLTMRSTQSRYLTSGNPQWGWSPCAAGAASHEDPQ